MNVEWVRNTRTPPNPLGDDLVFKIGARVCAVSIVLGKVSKVVMSFKCTPSWELVDGRVPRRIQRPFRTDSSNGRYAAAHLRSEA